MEWRYLKEIKKYLISLLFLGISKLTINEEKKKEFLQFNISRVSLIHAVFFGIASISSVIL